jgi:hypothetical protein
MGVQFPKNLKNRPNWSFSEIKVTIFNIICTIKPYKFDTPKGFCGGCIVTEPLNTGIFY